MRNKSWSKLLGGFLDNARNYGNWFSKVARKCVTPEVIAGDERSGTSWCDHTIFHSSHGDEFFALLYMPARIHLRIHKITLFKWVRYGSRMIPDPAKVIYDTRKLEGNIYINIYRNFYMKTCNNVLYSPAVWGWTSTLCVRHGVKWGSFLFCVCSANSPSN